jgi:tetraacyldisaccharide 4'-kinase
MRTPGFWHRRPGLVARLLWPLGRLYGAVTAWRMARRGRSVGIPVICIGNFTAGGTGKTPAAIHVAQLLLSQGRRPVFLSRGHGGRLAGPAQVDPARHSAADCGDEPLLLARIAPVVVAQDRIAGARLAAGLGADVIVMDDGLQNPSLAKDAVIAVVDGATGFGNGYCLPAGPLRAPLWRQWPHADAVLIVGEDATDVAGLAGGRPVLRGRLAPAASDVAALAGRRLLAFAGIGRPSKFFDTLREAGLDVARTQAFADHHPYSVADADRLEALAAAEGLLPVTTEKDAVRWPRRDVATVGVTLALDPGDADALAAVVSRRRPTGT